MADTVRIRCTWESAGEIEPPDGMTLEVFEQKLGDNDRDAWDHALSQMDAGSGELYDWRLV